MPFPIEWRGPLPTIPHDVKARIYFLMMNNSGAVPLTVKPALAGVVYLAVHQLWRGMRGAE